MGYDRYMLCHECKEYIATDYPDDVKNIQSFLYKHRNCGVNYFPTEQEVREYNSAVHQHNTGDLQVDLGVYGVGGKSMEDTGWIDFEENLTKKGKE